MKILRILALMIVGIFFFAQTMPHGQKENVKKIFYHVFIIL